MIKILGVFRLDLEARINSGITSEISGIIRVPRIPSDQRSRKRNVMRTSA